jgi:hypothetical protein
MRAFAFRVEFLGLVPVDRTYPSANSPMHSTLNPEQTDPNNVFAHVNEEIARAYEQIALADKQISKLAHDDARHPSDHPLTRVRGQPAVAWRARGTRLHRLNVDSVHLCRCHRLAVVLR